MGRKKSYDRDELIAKAMEIFRDHGYAGTSTQMLVEGLGVNRNSMYSEFGSKQALFDEALARYDAQVVERNFGPLEAPGAGVAEVRALLEFFGAADASPASGRGCFLCNTAVEFGAEDPSGAGFVARYFDRVSRAFRKALDNARRQGDIDKSTSATEEARFFTACVLGMFVMLRAKAPPKVIKSASKVAVAHLDQLSAQRQ